MPAGIDQFWIGTNTPSSKNGKIWTGKFLINKKSVAIWMKKTDLEWEYQRERFLDVIFGLPFPLYIEFTFIRNSKRRFDI